MRQHHGRGQNRAERVREILPRDRWGRKPCTGSNIDVFPGMNIAAGRHAEATLQPGGEVGNDIAKHVIGDNDVERPPDRAPSACTARRRTCAAPANLGEIRRQLP